MCVCVTQKSTSIEAHQKCTHCHVSNLWKSVDVCLCFHTLHGMAIHYVQIVEEGLLSLSGAFFDWQVLFWSLISSCTPHAWLHVSWSLGQNPLGRHPCILPYLPWRFESGSWYDTPLHDAAVPPDHGSISMYFYSICPFAVPASIRSC